MCATIYFRDNSLSCCFDCVEQIIDKFGLEAVQNAIDPVYQGGGKEPAYYTDEKDLCLCPFNIEKLFGADNHLKTWRYDWEEWEK